MGEAQPIPPWRRGPALSHRPRVARILRDYGCFDILGTDNRATSRVSSGENAGRTLTHVAVVRSLVKVGAGAGVYSGQVRFSMAQSSGADRLVVFVQEPGGGPVHAAGTASLR